MAGVRLRSLVKRYGPVSVIRGLDLEIQDQEFMVLVGPSGCGKSTVLRMIAGLEEITGGTIAIGDRIVNDVPPKDRDIAMVFQNYALYPHMTVRENLEFGLKIRRLPQEEIGRTVGETAEILGIADLLDRRPKQLSGGQRQRVAVGRAIVRHPSVFLFDEPLSNLDAKLRVLMRAEITKLQQRLKTTCIYVTHDQIEAMTMGHRIAVMESGELQQVGSPLEVYHRPANLFVAQFIGTPPMNFFRATIAEGGTGLVTPRFTLPVPPAWRPMTSGRDGLVVTAGIRPENIDWGDDDAGASAPRVTVDVEMVELLGHQAILHGRLGDDRLVATLEPRRLPKFGDRTTLAIDTTALHIFDGKTERRLEPAA